MQGSGVEDKVRVSSVPPEVFRKDSAVVTEPDVVVCGLVIFVADGLVQSLRGIEMGLRQFAGSFLLAFKSLLELGGVEQQLAVRRRELLTSFAFGIEELAKVLRVKVELRLAGRKRVAART